MLPAGIMASWATDWLGPENVRRTKVRWSEQVWPGDVLTFTGKVARKYEERGEKRVDLELATRQYRPQSLAEKAKAGFAIYGRAEDASRLRRILDEYELTREILTL